MQCRCGLFGEGIETDSDKVEWVEVMECKVFVPDAAATKCTESN